ncbi:hypothetical protein E2562_014557 [Oryza meyeriana var. granulata]|uniref:Uncharacterized protein n=1 Tax=Oryza meyeriana var. granulata TaxID=110450 RepID=A0A6G1EJI5_9ORYZ|nr:hypothetical protein E2562_014557 [Oryza meyeriana var. granulata]
MHICLLSHPLNFSNPRQHCGVLRRGGRAVSAERAAAAGLRWSERPCGREGKATPVVDHPEDSGTRQAGAGDTWKREGKTNRAVGVIGESSPPAPRCG